MKEAIFTRLMHYSRVHELNKGLSSDKISEFEAENGIVLPQDLKELYSHFDGGELFVPGATVYGIYDSSAENTVKCRNSGVVRRKTSLPLTYLIIARLNYGDLVCVSLNAPYKVIQWSHEDDELFCEWESIEQWLSEMISDYEAYTEGEA